MRQTLSNILRIGGLALGIGAGVLVIALQWPDVMSDLHNIKADRHVFRMFTSGIMLASLIGWPFLWVADKLSPAPSSDGDGVAHPGD
jgi:hypothetical protein